MSHIDVCIVVAAPVGTPSILRRGLSLTAVDGRIPGDVSVGHTLDFLQKYPGSSVRTLLTV